jgi:hypothetical protein
MRIPHVFAFTLAACLGAAAANAQPKFDVLGPNQCINCHDHGAEKLWWEKNELLEVRKLFPDKGANAGHINGLNQMETPKSDEYAKAIGLTDKYDVNGGCVACHATVWRGEANAGVSCESCHGPGSGYLKPHVEKGAYEESVAKYGMTRLVGNLKGWTQQCTNCHVMNDDRLIKAGHPSGDDFDLSKKYAPVALHFKKMYAEADVAAVARPEFDAIVRRRRGLPPVAVPAVAAAPTSAAGPESARPAAEIARPAPEAARPIAEPATPATTDTSKPSATSAAPSPSSGTAKKRGPVVQTINLTTPPPGSPTSIEPAVPIEAAPTAAPAAPAAADPSSAPAATEAAPETTEPVLVQRAWYQNVWLWLVVLVVGGAAVARWWGRRG